MVGQSQTPPSSRGRTTKRETQKERSLRTRQAILEGCAVVFAQTPYSAVRIHDLLEQEGVTQGGIYHHFPGAKEEIAAEIISEMLRAQEEIARSSMGEDGIKSIAAISRHLVDELNTSVILRAGWRLITHNEGVFGDAAGSGVKTVLAECLQRARESGDLRDGLTTEQAVEGFYSIFVGTQINSFLRSGWRDLPQSIRHMESFALRAIATDEYLESADFIGKPGYP